MKKNISKAFRFWTTVNREALLGVKYCSIAFLGLSAVAIGASIGQRLTK